MSNKKILAALFITSAVLLAACSTDSSATTANTMGQPSGKPPGGMSMAPATPPALTDEQTAQLKAGTDAHDPTTLTFNVVGGNFFYVPNSITVKKGDTVNIVFQNSGGTHNLNIDEYGVKMKTIKTGESDTAQFVADKAGTFQYYCSIGSHRQMGQQGTLIVQ